MKKNTQINVKNTLKNKKPISDSSLIITSKNTDKALEKRKKENKNIEEFTEWK
ncbi:hypothetical protein [Endozoicomonas numazuensis]|uniref:hypothetical protein n=1 Tax=Endozoicomonas numazuensis TaxID=1137799 RepID=UPI000ABCF742|nr:hypothetical protein [Endozoicomonas numazuensis]